MGSQGKEQGLSEIRLGDGNTAGVEVGKLEVRGEEALRGPNLNVVRAQ